MASSASPAKRARDEAAGAGAGSGAGPDDSDATGPRGEASLWAVCVDGSDHSTTALQWAIDHMQRDEDQLLLLTVVEGVECRVPNPPSYMVKAQREMNEALEARANAVLADGRKVCADAGVAKYDVRLLMSEVRAQEAICKVAEELDVDTLVLSRRGLTPKERTIMGSVSQYVVQHAHCDVVLVRANRDR